MFEDPPPHQVPGMTAAPPPPAYIAPLPPQDTYYTRTDYYTPSYISQPAFVTQPTYVSQPSYIPVSITCRGLQGGICLKHFIILNVF